MIPKHPTHDERTRSPGSEPAADGTHLPFPEQVIRILVIGLAVAYSYLLLN